MTCQNYSILFREVLNHPADVLQVAVADVLLSYDVPTLSRVRIGRDAALSLPLRCACACTRDCTSAPALLWLIPVGCWSTQVQQKQQVASLQEAVREVMQEEHAKLHDEIMDEVYSSHDHDHHFEQEYHQDHHHHDHARQPLSAEEESLDLEDLQQSSAEFLLEDVPEGELVDGAYVSAVQQLVHGAGHGETWHHERDGLHSHHPPDHGPHYDHHEAASHSHWSHSHNIDSHAHASHYHTDHSHAEEAHHHDRHEPSSHAAPHSDGHELPTRLHHSHEDHLHNHGRSHGVAHHPPHSHPHHHDVESIHEEIHEQMDSLTAGRQDVQVRLRCLG